MKISRLLVALLAILIGRLQAADTVTLKAPIANIAIATNGVIAPIDLRNHFEVTGVQGTVVHFDTNLGAFDVEMFDSTSPNTVTNFLRYVNEARFANSMVHRSQTQIEDIGLGIPPYKIIQGGSFLADVNLSGITPLTNCNTTLGSTTVTCQSTAQAAVGMTVVGIPVSSGTTITAIGNATTFAMSKPALSTETAQNFTVAYPAIPMETGITTPNDRATIAMARTGDPNSATSGWFFNVGNNSVAFPPASAPGGYAVFGRVMGTGMSIVDAIAALPIFSNFGPPFGHIPYIGTLPGGGDINLANLVVVNTMTSGPVFPTAVGQNSFVRFSGTLTNGSLLDPSLIGSTLNLAPTPRRAGFAKATVSATDLAGTHVDIPFTITVTGGSTTNTDVNSDFIDDILLQNNAGQILSWTLNGSGGIATWLWISINGLGDWRVVEQVDVNGDGTTDVVFQNNTGQVLAWFMNGTGGVSGGGWLFPSGLGDWKVVGMADLNRDGAPDILLQNSAGYLLARMTDGFGNPTGWAWIYLAGLGDWKVVAITDMNRDAINDLVLQNTAGQILVWLLDGSGNAVNLATGQGLKPGSGYLFAGGLGGWTVAAMPDLNIDGIPDLLLQYPTGQLLGWLLDGTARTINLSTGQGLKPGSGYIYTGLLGDWRVR